MSISALLSVYNEEERIEYTLRTLQWCDEILILDKNSTDRTREIARNFGAKIYLWDKTEFDPAEATYLLEKCTTEWVICFTASDIIHPKLALQIKDLTTRKDFEYDVIMVPFYTYVLGINSRRSPWYTDLKSYVVRRSVFKIINGVHNMTEYNTNRFYKLNESKEYCIYHLTHVNVDTMLERHTRYWRAEAKYFNDPNLRASFRRFFIETLRVLFKRKSFLIGWNGVMLSFAYISYFMMSLVYKWEKKYSNAPEVYLKIRNDLVSEWEKVK